MFFHLPSVSDLTTLVIGIIGYPIVCLIFSLAFAVLSAKKNSVPYLSAVRTEYADVFGSSFKIFLLLFAAYTVEAFTVIKANQFLFALVALIVISIVVRIIRNKRAKAKLSEVPHDPDHSDETKL